MSAYGMAEFTQMLMNTVRLEIAKRASQLVTFCYTSDVISDTSREHRIYMYTDNAAPDQLVNYVKELTADGVMVGRGDYSPTYHLKMMASSRRSIFSWFLRYTRFL